MIELQIENLSVSVDGKRIVDDISLSVKSGEIIALMGPNGSGKSTLVHTIMGHPKYKVESGKITLDNENITSAKPNERAKLGLFLSFQYPSEIDGVTIAHALRTMLNERNGKATPIPQFIALLKEKMSLLGMGSPFAQRYLNHGFSGGEKKRCEILQLSILEPKIALLDETDSGLDIDALKTVAEGIKKVAQQANMGILLVTHYQRILNYIQPNRVLVMKGGKIIAEGTEKLAKEIEERGYDWIDNLHKDDEPKLGVSHDKKT